MVISITKEETRLDTRGRGGNTRFPTFQLKRNGPMDRPTDRQTDGWTGKASYRVACPQLKKRKKERKKKEKRKKKKKTRQTHKRNKEKRKA